MAGMQAENSARRSARELFDGHRPLAAKIAAGFSNIPRATPDEIETTADQALWDAARNFENREGNFEAYAVTVIQNRLRDLHRKSSRLDERQPLYDPLPGTEAAAPEPVSSPSPVVEQIARNETSAYLEGVLGRMDPRRQDVLRRTAAGESGSEIGEALGISKQMVSKILASAREEAQEKIRDIGLRYEGCVLRSQSAAPAAEPAKPAAEPPRPMPAISEVGAPPPGPPGSPSLWQRILRAIGLGRHV